MKLLENGPALGRRAGAMSIAVAIVFAKHVTHVH